jgi:hypothetical protein
MSPDAKQPVPLVPPFPPQCAPARRVPLARRDRFDPDGLIRSPRPNPPSPLPRFVQLHDPAQLTVANPAVSVQEQKFPVPMPTGTQPSAVLEVGGQRQAQDGVDAHAAGVGSQDRPVSPAVPGV